MAAVRAGLWSGERRFNRGKLRAGEVAFAIELLAAAVIQQIMAAIENDPARVGEVGREFFNTNQHRSLLIGDEIGASLFPQIPKTAPDRHERKDRSTRQAQ